MRHLAVVLLLALAGCQSQWYLQHDRPELVTTHVIVRTDPPKAAVSLNGVPQNVAPVRIPIEYHHIEELWTRQSNYGARMREDWAPIVQIVTLPIWGVASFFHFNEDRRRHKYGGNTHELTARKMGYHDARQVLVLEGEAEVEVTLSLHER